MKLSLNGQWQFRATDEDDYLAAVVPGCQFLDLMRDGIIPDPFWGTNEKDVQWVHDKDYLYVRYFALTPDELKADRIELVCEQLDTIAELSLNGQPLGKAANCHLRHVFDAKAMLRAGDNELSILFHSPKRYVEARYKESPSPVNANGQNGIVHIRKPQCHFGWDWGPVLTPVGISGDIYLDLGCGPRLSEPVVRTLCEDGRWQVAVHAEGAQCVRLVHPDGRVDEAEGDEATFAVAKPQLWWTHELSPVAEQPLYTVEAVRGEERRSRKVGLRTIRLDRSKDRYGYNFRFVLNGVPLFIKGANYIPPDSFMPRYDEKRLMHLMDAVQYANLNMIRVWGGGYYADDGLLDECDRRGILVWQDCMFACQAYPFFDDEFRRNVLEEIDYNVRRIGSHPSLALWCGNNEIETMHLAWATMHRYVEWTERFFYHILPDEIAQYDPDTPYIAGSPVGSAHNKDVDADHVGDTHLWGVWHGLKPMTYYRRRMTRFCSEFGFESLPSMATIASYAEPKDYPLRSAVQRAHQKCAGGNDKMLYYVASRFHLSEDVEDLVYLSQVTQQTCIADATEHWRRNKGRCNGAMYWQLNDCWPTCSWSSYDYRGQYKALHYAARHFNAPISVSLQDDKKRVAVHVLNDLNTDQTVEVGWCVFDFDRAYPAETRQVLTVPALSNVVAGEIDLGAVDPRRQGVAVHLYRDGRCVMQKICLLRPEKKLALPRGDVEVREETVDGKRRITLRSAVYQRLVMLSNDSPVPFDDNFFDLLPGVEKVVWQEDADLRELRIKTVASLGRAPLGKTVAAMCKVFLSPRNIANAVYHGRVPKEYKEE